MHELIEILMFHNTKYYIDCSPIISDGEYDCLFQALLTLEKNYPLSIQPDSPTQKLLGQKDGFSQSTHIYPLLSLQNTYSAKDVLDR